MSELTFDVTLANRIKQALLRNGITDAADLDWLATGTNIADVRRVRLGHAVVTHLIDCTAEPFNLDYWKAVEHRKSGVLKWDVDAQKDAFYLSERQQGDGWISGHELRKELADKPVLNANVLDFLLDNPRCIPEEWKGGGRKAKRVFFWGTIYDDYRDDLRDDLRYVRFLYWDGDEWGCGSYSLNYSWEDTDPAAILAA